MRRAVWAWRAEELKSPLLKRWRIGRVYLQYEERSFEAKVQSLRGKLPDLEIYALAGSLENLYAPERLIKRWERLSGLGIRGVQLDLEPYLLAEYSRDPSRVLKRYLKVLEKVGRWAGKKGLCFSVAIPFWFRDLLLEGRPLIREILDRVDEAVVMSYRKDPLQVMAISRDPLRWGELLKKPISIGVELKREKKDPGGICAAERFFHLQCGDTERRSSEGISFYGDRKGLESLLGMPVPSVSFDTLVLHDISVLQEF